MTGHVRHWEFTSGSFRALGHEFGIRSADPEVGLYLSDVLGALAVPGQPERWYSIDATAPGGGGPVWWDGRAVVEAGTPTRQVGALLWWIKDAAIDSRPGHVLVHASAVERQGRAVLAVAESGGGKSTLAAGLTRAGCRYLTDEAVAIDPRTGLVEPFPKPIALDPGSWAALADLRPAGDPLHDPFEAEQWRVDPRFIRPDAVSSAVPVGSIIAVRYDPDATTRLEPISPAEGLFVVASNLHRPLPRRSDALEALHDLVRGCTYFRLTTSDLDEAVRLVLENAVDPERSPTGSAGAPRR